MIDGTKHIASWKKNTYPIYKDQCNKEAHKIIKELTMLEGKYLTKKLWKRVADYMEVVESVEASQCLGV
jgi:hypothetical protein